MGGMTMKCEGTKKCSQITRNIGEMAKCLSQIKYLTFIQAFGGCDTVAATCGLGKIFFTKKKIAKEAADEFLSPESAKDELGEAGAKLFVTLYGGKTCDDLIDLQ